MREGYQEEQAQARPQTEPQTPQGVPEAFRQSFPISMHRLLLPGPPFALGVTSLVDSPNTAFPLGGTWLHPPSNSCWDRKSVPLYFASTSFLVNPAITPPPPGRHEGRTGLLRGLIAQTFHSHSYHSIQPFGELTTRDEHSPSDRNKEKLLEKREWG